MIDYALLCQAIADWKAGRAPSTVTASTASEPETYDDVEEFVEEVAEQTVIYQLPIEPLDDDDL